MAVLPSLDRQRVEDLFGGDLVEMRAFLVSTAALLRSRCEQLAAASEPQEMRELAHEVRGAALNVGAVALAATLKNVESELRVSQTLSSTAVAAVLQSCLAFETAVQNIESEEPPS